MNDKSHIVESSAATDVVQDSYESMATILSPVEEPEPEKMKRICTLLAMKKTLINLKLMSLMMHYMSISLEMIAVLNQVTVMVRMLKKLVVNIRQTQMILSLQLMVRDYTLAWLAI